MFQGVDHVSRYYDAEAMYAFVNGGKVKEHHLNRWNPNQSEAYNLTHASYPLLHYDSYGDHNQRKNSFFLKNGNFLRLKNIDGLCDPESEGSNRYPIMKTVNFGVNIKF